MAFKSNFLCLFSLDTVLDTSKLTLNFCCLTFDASGLVNDFLDSRASRLQCQAKLILLSSKTIIYSLYLGTLFQCSINIGFCKSNLVLIFLFEFSKLSALESWFDSQPDLHPQPGLSCEVISDCSLASIEGKFLILQLLEVHSGSFSSGSSLKPRKNRANLVFTSFFHNTKNTSTEEHLSVTKSKLFFWQLDQIKDCASSSFVILGLGNKGGSQDVVSSFEFRIQHLIWEAGAANCNAGQHTIALILVHHKIRLNTSRLLMSVGDNTTDEVRLSLVESGHQVIKLALEERRYSLAATLLLPVLVLWSLKRLARVISKRSNHQRVASILDHLNNSVIKRILVLLQPSSQVVRHSGGIVNDSKVCIRVRSWVRLGKLGPFSKHVGHQLFSKGFVSSFWEEGLFFKDGKEGHWLFKHINTLLKIHAKINISPVKTFLDILLLFKGEHVLIKELLQLLIDIIDANLFEAVVVENFEPCDVKDTNISDLLHGWIAKGFITFVNNKTEGAFIDATSDTRNRACCLGTC